VKLGFLRRSNTGMPPSRITYAIFRTFEGE
jgi:hypothetical protein